MFNLGPFELVAIFVVALLVFGPDKLPEIGKQVGRAFKEFKKFQDSMQANVRDVMEPIAGPIQSAMQDNAQQVRDALEPITGNGGKIQAPDFSNSSNVNVPRSATIQTPELPDGEEAAPAGSFGHYVPVDPPAPAPGDTPASPGADEPPAPADPDTR
jgi:sec-independent protein translocase protein TatB